LLTASDDVTPGAHPVAVLSHDYWSRRFGCDPGAVGRTFRIGNDSYEIVGVLEDGFTGTETGKFTDIFLPTMMNAAAIDGPDTSWFRTWVQLRPGASAELVRQRLEATLHALRRERVKTWRAGTPRDRIEQYVKAPVSLDSASAGVSWMQDTYRTSLWILGALVALVLLIACANVANLMTAQAASRARDMALRVSIGAGRSRLVQLVLIESSLVAFAASLAGVLFASWAAPFVVSMINPPHDPARLVLAADWRLFGFAAALAFAVTLLFGLLPALRASAVKPIAALRGGEDPHSRRRLMNTLVAAQVAFCLLVHFVAGLFVSSFARLANQPAGFTSDRVLVLDTVAKGPQPHNRWDEVLESLRSAAGVESVGLSRWALLSGSGWNQYVWANGRSPDASIADPYFHAVSPGWLDTMTIPLLDGRDFRAGETYPNVAIVNQAFALRYFDGQNPVGKMFEKLQGRTRRVRVAIVGYVRDARYADMREPIRPTVYVPFRRFDDSGVLESPARGTFVVRTAGADPLQMASMLRQAVPQARSEFRVSNVRTQEELVRMHTVRERLLALLSLFFAVVALLLAGVGLYGVLDYSVVQRRREIGIRLALGAQPGHIVVRLTAEVASMILLGAAVGLGLGSASERYIGTLLYQVTTTDPALLAAPLVMVFTAAGLASLPPLIRAVRTDPVATMRAE
jgi:predicted permease